MAKHHSDKDKSNFSRLREFVENTRYIDIVAQPQVCKDFDLPYMKNIFRDVYRSRFYDYLQNEITTIAKVSRDTGIPVQYLTTCKTRFEKAKLLKVVYKGICPISQRQNVQFITTNKEWL